MNIILSIPDDKTANYYIINALQDLGHVVYHVNHRVNVPAAKRNVDYILQNKEIDCMMVAHFATHETYDAHYIQMLKINYPKMKILSMFFDVYIGGKISWQNEEFVELMKQYDYSFFVTPTDVKEMRKKGVNAYEMFFGFDASLTPCTVIKKDLDISFIGQFGFQNNVVHLGRLPYLDRICQEFKNVEIYGSCGSFTDAIREKYMGRGTYNDREYARVVARSKISFGYSDFGPNVPLYSYPNRVVHTLGFGGFLMYNRIPILERDFVDLEHLVMYNSIDECIMLMKHYLENDAKRVEIAFAGREYVLGKYTWCKSLSNIFDIMGLNLYTLRYGKS